MMKGFGRPLNEESIIHSSPTVYKGEPTFLLTNEEDEMLAEPFKPALIGIFSKGRPSMEYLWTQFQKIGFKGEFSLGHAEIDCQHVKGNRSEAEGAQKNPKVAEEQAKKYAATDVFKGNVIANKNTWKQKEASLLIDEVVDKGKKVSTAGMNSKRIDEDHLQENLVVNTEPKESSSGIVAAEKDKIPIDVIDNTPPN
ncbi:OLC1v1013200C1 [Oldenlandia corymbosa var. corymbosa]|uniref:OLC1v1013200C1 n=1 Tax=Oldenlandia corymbosa var. corymbosa TaxID=529605 RepID=A0AAV1E0Y3_OLDCO|nr:OLC1v1013200C1 [Oldenlandia corymbosa var. corymbosa]